MPSEAVFRPAPREGLSASRVRAGSSHVHVLAFLQARLPHVADWPQRLQAGAVLDARGRPARPDDPCPLGTLLWYWRSAGPETPVPHEVVVLHRCERLLVVDKPPFLAVTPAGRHVRETVQVRLQAQLGLTDLAPLHRLDRDTSGVMAFSVQPSSRGVYQALWRERRVRKSYEAIAPWSDALPFPLTARHRLQEPAGRNFHQMQVLPGEPNCETLVERLHELDPHTVPGAVPGQRLALYRLSPLTGRKHQLRAQMAALGLPLVNDRVYPTLQPEGPDDLGRPLMLLARRLGFADPLDGQERCFESRMRLGG
jgi:tRNA pseudouridine32 synthase/23S rRNA pseudouridine746 synthase